MRTFIIGILAYLDEYFGMLTKHMPTKLTSILLIIGIALATSQDIKELRKEKS